MTQEQSHGLIPFKKEGNKWLVLLVQNKNGKFWGFPKGHAEGKETSKQAAERELFEETGLHVKRYIKEDPLIERYTYYRDRKKISKKVLYYAVEAIGNINILQEEILDCLWLPIDEAFSTLTYPEGKKLLEQAIKGALLL